MIPAHYFPFAVPRYELKIGAAPLSSPDLVFERDDVREQELALKRACMEFDAHYYCQTLPGSEEAQREVLAMVGGAEEADCAIRAAGDRVQEDLLILDCGQAGLPLIAGHLCFANAWCLDDKMGRSFMEIHGPVPEFPTTIGPASEKLLERLKVGRPVGRLNWAVKSTGQMDLTSRWDETVAAWNREVDAANAGARCFMRAERQTLTRLEKSNCVLFTVRTYTQTVASLTVTQQKLLLGVLRTCPEAMLRYKGIWPFAPALVEWLGEYTNEL